MFLFLDCSPVTSFLPSVFISILAFFSFHPLFGVVYFDISTCYRYSYVAFLHAPFALDPTTLSAAGLRCEGGEMQARTEALYMDGHRGSTRTGMGTPQELWGKEAAGGPESGKARLARRTRSGEEKRGRVAGMWGNGIRAGTRVTRALGDA